MVRKRSLGIGLCKSTILLDFEAEFTESVLGKLSYPQKSTTRPALVGPKEKFS